MKTGINYTHKIFNHKSEQILQQTCKEYNIKQTGKLQPWLGGLDVKAKRKRILKATKARATDAGETLFLI